MPIWEAIGRLSDAVLESMVDPSHQTATELQNALLDYASLTRNAMMVPLWWTSLAENYLAIGDPDRALEANDRAFEFGQQSDEHWSDSELLRVRGVALAMRDGVDGNDEAEGHLRGAIEDARSRSAKSFELRAAVSLARFLLDQGRSAEAREALAPIYDWFTEGFDTPDLIDGRALLDELA
jgi:predicted ATPase